MTKILIDRAVVEQALEALENERSRADGWVSVGEHKAITIFRAALVEPAEQEPVSAPQGWMLVPVKPTVQMLAELGFNGDYELAVCHAATCADLDARYRAMLAAAPEAPQPAKREPLTDKRRLELWHSTHEAHGNWSAYQCFCYGIECAEAAHGITKE